MKVSEIRRIGDFDNNRGHALGLSFASTSILSRASSTIVSNFNSQYLSLSSELLAKQNDLNNKLTNLLKQDPLATSLRRKGVDLSWEYEKADVSMGGSGSNKWNAPQKAEILENGRLPDYDGHHIKSVSNNPEYQVDANNIKMMTREDHLQKGHGGDWRNPSDGELIDKQKMLRRTNQRRVFRQEAIGFGISVAIGFGVGFGITLALEISKTGLKNVSKSYLLSKSLLGGLKSSFAAGLFYVGTRFLVGKVGIGIENANLIVGLSFISVSSAIEYARLRLEGVSRGEALLNVAKGSIVPLAIVSSTFAATLIGGPVIGTITGIVLSLGAFGYSLYKNVHSRELSEKIDRYVVELHYQGDI